MIARLWRRYTVTRSMAQEFGPTDATRFPELLRYSDRELIRRSRADLIAEIEDERAVAAEIRRRQSTRTRKESRS